MTREQASARLMELLAEKETLTFPAKYMGDDEGASWRAERDAAHHRAADIVREVNYLARTYGLASELGGT